MSVTFAQDLDNMRTEYRGKFGPTIVGVMDAARDAEFAKPEPAALKTFPAFALQDSLDSTATVDSAALLEKGPLVVVFYRGGWCPYCNRQLRELQKFLPAFTAAGASVVAVSPERADVSEETVKKNELGFPVVVDDGLKIARGLGIAFELPEPLKDVYQNFGIDLEATQQGADGKWELPYPAAYVVRKDGTVAFTRIDKEYERRADPAALLEVVRGL